MPFAVNHNFKIHYELSGQGPILTICGGLGDSWRNWQILIQKLAVDFRVLYVQNRGAGQSGRPTVRYTIDDMATDVLAVLQHEKIAKTHLLGFSLGGRIAQKFALLYPEFLQKLILVSTAADWQQTHPAAKNVIQQVHAFQGTDADFAKLFDILYSPQHRQHFSERAFAKFRRADPYPQTLLDYQLQLEAITHFDIRKDLTKIATPSLILAGDQDALTPYLNAQVLHAGLKHSEMRLYQNTGHLLPYEKTKEFLADVQKFLIEPGETA